MMKAVGVLAFAVMMLVAGVTEVPAVAFNSAGGQGSCTGNVALPGPTPATCGGGWVAVAPDPLWQPNTGGAVWVSFTGGTGSGGVVVTLDVCLDRALQSWILSFGPFARVVSPDGLAREIAGQLAEATARYAS